VPDRPRKSSGSETTFSNDLTAPADIEAGVQAMADEVWAWCEKAQAFGRTVTVKIKYADFQQTTRSRTLPANVTSQETLREVSVGLVRTVFPPTKGIRLVGVTLSGFERPDSTSPEQFPAGWGTTREEAVSRLIAQREFQDRAHRECWPDLTVADFVEVGDFEGPQRRKAFTVILGGKACESRNPVTA
jgi:hypothetical protein